MIFQQYQIISCLDVNECDEQEVNCGTLAECVNTPGSYKCQCIKGFSGSCENCISTYSFGTSLLI